MHITFLGAAQTVTGSCYLLEAAGKRFAIDCGMHQGNAEIEKRNRDLEPYAPDKIDFFLITHAHIDHTGLLPRMSADGFKGPIYCTRPTRDLMEIMLLDSAHIQETEAEWQKKKRSRSGGNHAPEPLYTVADAQRVAERFQAVEYKAPFEPAPGISVTYHDAGHILGSAFVELIVTENGAATRLLFSGDLGRPHQLIVRDPEKPVQTDYLFLETTYGDRDHKDSGNSLAELAEAIEYSYKSGGKVIIPAFAVERTQQVLYSLHLVHKAGKLPADMPVYLDSPLAIRATKIFRRYQDFYDNEMKKLIDAGEDPLSLPDLRFTEGAKDSQALNELKGSAIIISASGMCNAGRVRHHLRHNLWRKETSVVFVGYQSEGTPGRKLVDGVKSLRLFNEDIAVKARIYTIGGFSGHAGQSELLTWVSHFNHPEKLKVFLVHGEKEAQTIFSGLLKERFGIAAHIPEYLENLEIQGQESAFTLPDQKAVRPAVNWDYLLNETEEKVRQLRGLMPKIAQLPWPAQADVRDNLAELNARFIKLMSEL